MRDTTMLVVTDLTTANGRKILLDAITHVVSIYCLVIYIIDVIIIL